MIKHSLINFYPFSHFYFKNLDFVGQNFKTSNFLNENKLINNLNFKSDVLNKKELF